MCQPHDAPERPDRHPTAHLDEALLGLPAGALPRELAAVVAGQFESLERYAAVVAREAFFAGSMFAQPTATRGPTLAQQVRERIGLVPGTELAEAMASRANRLMSGREVGPDNVPLAGHVARAYACRLLCGPDDPGRAGQVNTLRAVRPRNTPAVAAPEPGSIEALQHELQLDAGCTEDLEDELVWFLDAWRELTDRIFACRLRAEMAGRGFAEADVRGSLGWVGFRGSRVPATIERLLGPPARDCVRTDATEVEPAVEALVEAPVLHPAQPAIEPPVEPVPSALADGLHLPRTLVYGDCSVADVPLSAVPLLKYMLDFPPLGGTGYAEKFLLDELSYGKAKSLKSHCNKANDSLEEVCHPRRLVRVEVPGEGAYISWSDA